MSSLFLSPLTSDDKSEKSSQDGNGSAKAFESTAEKSHPQHGQKDESSDDSTCPNDKYIISDKCHDKITSNSTTSNIKTASKSLANGSHGLNDIKSKCVSFDHNSVSQLNYQNNQNNNDHSLNNKNSAYNGKSKNVADAFLSNAQSSQSNTVTSQQQQQPQQQQQQQQSHNVISSTCSSSCSSHSDQSRKVNKVTHDSDHDTTNIHGSMMDEKTKNVWDYLLQQPDTPRRIHREDVTDEDEDDDYEDQHSGIAENDEEDDAQREQQLINFKAKIFAFETLAKGECNSSTASTASMTISANKSVSSTSSSSSTISSSGGHGNHSVPSKGKSITGSSSVNTFTGRSSHQVNPNYHHQHQASVNLMERELKNNGERVTGKMQPQQSVVTSNNRSSVRTGHSPNLNDESTGICNSSSPSNLVSNCNSVTSVSSSSSSSPSPSGGRNILPSNSSCASGEVSYANGLSDHSRHHSLHQQQQQQQASDISDVNHNAKVTLATSSSSSGYHSKNSHVNGSLLSDVNTIDQVTGNFASATALTSSAGTGEMSSTQRHCTSSSSLPHHLSHLMPQFTSSASAGATIGSNVAAAAAASTTASIVTGNSSGCIRACNNGSLAGSSDSISNSSVSTGQSNGHTHIGHTSPELLHSSANGPFAPVLGSKSSSVNTSIHHQRDYTTCTSNGVSGSLTYPSASQSSVPIVHNQTQIQAQVSYSNTSAAPAVHSKAQLHHIKQASMAHLLPSSQQHQQQLFYDSQNQYANQQLVNEQLAALAAAAQHQNLVANSAPVKPNTEINVPVSSSYYHKSTYMTPSVSTVTGQQVTYDEPHTLLSRAPVMQEPLYSNQQPVYLNQQTIVAQQQQQQQFNHPVYYPKPYHASNGMIPPKKPLHTLITGNNAVATATAASVSSASISPLSSNLPSTSASAVTTPAISSMTSSSSLVPGYNQTHWLMSPDNDTRRSIVQPGQMSNHSGKLQQTTSQVSHANLMTTRQVSTSSQAIIPPSEQIYENFNQPQQLQHQQQLLAKQLHHQVSAGQAAAQQSQPQQQQQQPTQTTVPGQQNMLSVSGKKKCSNCGDELGRGCAAMVIESLSLYYHINCFRCSVCHIQLGNGTCGTDVRVRSHKLHCNNCYSNDEGELK